MKNDSSPFPCHEDVGKDKAITIQNTKASAIGGRRNNDGDSGSGCGNSIVDCSVRDNARSSVQVLDRSETIVGNPGISDRLVEDVVGFERYGFRFHQTSLPSGELGGILLATGTKTAAVTLWIEVSQRRLTASVGPFLRTLVRLCIDPIDPKTLRVVVNLAWRQSSSSPETETKKGTRKNKWKNRKSKRSNVNTKKNKSVSPVELTTLVNPLARTVAHEIHMIIRNSMGAALFLDLHIILPPLVSSKDVRGAMNTNNDGCYPYPDVHLHDQCQQHEAAKSEGNTKNGPGMPFGHRYFPRDLPQPRDGAPEGTRVPIRIPRSCLDGLEELQHQHIYFEVRTRMCTVRLTPVLFHLANKLLLPTKPTTSSSSLQQPPPQKDETKTTISNIKTDKCEQNKCGINNTVPLPKMPPSSLSIAQSLPWFVVCIEKVSNLFRVLMLLRDYGMRRPLSSSESATQTALDRLIIVTHAPLVERFARETEKFLANLPIEQPEEELCFHESSAADNKDSVVTNNKSQQSKGLPEVLSIEQAAEFLSSLSTQSSLPPSFAPALKQLKKNTFAGGENDDNENHQNKNGDDISHCSIVAVDLHSDAETLGLDPTVKNQQNILQHHFALSSSPFSTVNAILWGFEKDGIPPQMTKHADRFVQVRSRTSLNLVATVSIIVHVLWTTSNDNDDESQR